eukprot:gene11769-5107_t
MENRGLYKQKNKVKITEEISFKTYFEKKEKDAKILIPVKNMKKEEFIYFENFLKQTNKLKSITLSQGDEEGYKQIFEILKKIDKISSLSISRFLCPESSLFLTGYLNETKTLKNLSIRYDGDIEVLENLSNSLKINQTVEDLNLGYNYIQYKGCNIIGRIIKENRSIKKLNLVGNDINDGLFLIVDSLEMNETLSELSLSQNKILEDYFSEIGRLLKKNQFLKVLDLSNNTARTSGSRVIGASLYLNKTLKELNLNDNLLRNKGAIELSFGLEENQILEILHIANNNMGVDGMNEIFISLESNHSLKYLDISGQNVKPIKEGVQISQGLYSLLKNNQSLKRLNISRNPIQPDTIGLGLKVNYSLEQIELEDCRFNFWRPGNFSRFITCLIENKTLKTMNISNNKLGDERAIYIGYLISKTEVLNHLDIRNCDISLDGAKIIHEAVKLNRSLLQLQVGIYKIDEDIEEILKSNFDQIHFPKLKEINLKNINFKFR